MRSDNVTKGVERAPNRSLFYALGYTKEELERPLIGVVCSYNEIVPGHMNLDKIAEAVKAGVRAAGGTPVEFPAIAVCDGIAMGHIGMKYSLVTRDLIADSTEAMAIAHQFDGLVMIPNCDKNVPGLLMAAARVNVPTIFCSGGPMLAGRLEDGRRSCLSHMFEAVGAYKAGKLDEAGVEDYENNACPTCGSCSGMYTANSMNCLTEAIGMGLRGNGTIPAVWSARLRLAKHAGMQIMELVAKNIRPRDIMTPAAFHNAETVDMALGCSTNTMLHLPAIAHECGIELDLDLSNEISSKTPNLCHLAPAGDTYMEDLEGAGGVYAVMKELTKKGLLDTSVLTCTGKTLAENLEGVVNRNPELIRPIENPYSADGGIAVLKGNLAPEGCVVKRSAGGGHRGHLRWEDRPRRRGGHPLRGAQGRTRDAGDAQPHLRHLRHGAGRVGGPHHRRPLLRRHPRGLHRPRLPRGRPGRPHRPGGGGGHHFHRHPRLQNRAPGGRGHPGRPACQVDLSRTQDQDRLSGPVCKTGHLRRPGCRSGITKSSLGVKPRGSF